MSFSYSAPTSKAPTTPRPAPLSVPPRVPLGAPAPQGERDGDDHVRDVLAYRDGHKDALTFVRVESVDVEGDEVKLAERIERTDPLIGHVINDGWLADEFTRGQIDEWESAPLPFGRYEETTFIVCREDELLGRWKAVWTCSVRLRDLDSRRDGYLYPGLGTPSQNRGGDLFDAVSLDEDDLNYFAARRLLVPSHSGFGEVIEKLSNALADYLQGLSSTFTTPRDADECARIFFRRVADYNLEQRRFDFVPSMSTLVASAVDDAKPTPTGLDALDAIIGGGLVPGVYVVAGDPGSGKTALAVQTLLFAAHQCAEDERAVYVMLDQGGSAEVAKRLVSLAWAIRCEAEGEDDRRLLLTDAGRWDEESQEDGVRAFEDLSNERAVLLDLPEGSLHQLWTMLEVLQDTARIGVRLLVVDYYQLLRDVYLPGQIANDEVTGASVASDAALASSVMRNLRTWATDHGTPVLLVGQFTKESIQRHAKGGKPEITDLLGSVDVPYQAESVIMLANAHDGSGVVELSDAKHRHAGNDVQGERVARMLLDGERGYFRELDE